MSASPSKRRDMDLMKLMMAGFNVVMEDDEKAADFYVSFQGPKETYYEGGTWKVHVRLPMEYPYKSPSLGFSNRMYHPNVDEASGSVCLDVINQTWSPMFDLINVFEVFLPQAIDGTPLSARPPASRRPAPPRPHSCCCTPTRRIR